MASSQRYRSFFVASISPSLIAAHQSSSSLSSSAIFLATISSTLNEFVNGKLNLTESESEFSCWLESLLELELLSAFTFFSPSIFSFLCVGRASPEVPLRVAFGRFLLYKLFSSYLI